MRHDLAVVAVLGILLAVAAGCGGGNGGAETQAAGAATDATTAEHQGAGPVEVELQPVGDSGMSGTATLSDAEGDGIPTFVVEIAFEGEADASYPAHIHDVTCAEYAEIEDFDAQLGTVVDTLSNVSDGASKSNVPGEVAERATGEHSINVHEPAHPFPAIACGDIPAHE